MLLPVQITFRKVEGSAKLEELIQKEAAKLELFYDRITSCRVVVERPQRGASSKVYRVRIDLGLPNGELAVKHMPALHGTLRDIQADRSRREADAVLTHKTPQRAIREAFHEMRRRLQDYGRRQEGCIKSTQKMAEAVVAKIFPQKGYGFLETADNRQVYFHRASVLGDHFDQLRIAARVRFVEEMGENGPQASTVKLILPRKQARTAAAIAVLPRKLATAHSKR